MESAQIMNRPTSEDDDLGRATVRELIVKLALTEDEHRSTTNPGRIAALARREQAIVAALHQHELITKGPCHPPCRAQDTTLLLKPHSGPKMRAATTIHLST